MGKKKTYLMVGIFVTVGAFLAAAIIVWVGASRYFQKGNVYATYFNESVQGLQIDSAVKYRGVTIGTVRKIGVAPDYNLIEVLMKIDFKGDLANKTVAKLKVAGITGIVFIELDRIKEEDRALSPTLGFKPEYPVIPSKPSEIRQIFTDVEEVIKNIKEVNFKDVLEQLTKTAKAISDTAQSKAFREAIANIEMSAKNIEQLSSKVNGWVDDRGVITEILTETRDAVREARSVVHKVKTEIAGIDLAAMTGKVNQFVETAANRTNSVSTDLQIAVDNMRRVTDTLNTLIDQLNADPSALIFSTAPPPGRSDQ